jgi:outer membrane biosynthesis protein TonB
MAMAYSVILHGAMVGVAWLSTFHETPPFEFVSFEIELVSPPPAVQAEEVTPAREELVVERPAAEPEPVRPEPPPEAPRMERERPRPQPRPEPRRAPEPTPSPPEPSPRPTPAAGPEPAPDTPPAAGGEGINVRMEGLRRDFPEYYANIIRQINRCFRWPGVGTWTAQIYFVIQRDGTIRDLDVVHPSGNTAFDFEAMGAVECAAGQGRFGPLPEELPYESQPVLFEFRPSGR